MQTFVANEQSYLESLKQVSHLCDCLNSFALYYTLTNKSRNRTKLKKMMHILQLFQ